MSLKLLARTWFALCVGALAACSSAEQGAGRGVDVPPRWLTLFPDDAIHVLADDVNGDGRTDLVFTSHSGSYLQAFLQGLNRRFDAGPELKDIAGHHPNDLVNLPSVPKRYLLNAEGAGELRVVAPAGDGRLVLVAELPVAPPRTALPFSWPGWGLSVAVVPYGGTSLLLLRQFNAATGKAGRDYKLGRARGIKYLSPADTDGDGIDELWFTTAGFAPSIPGGVWRMRYPGPEGTPRPEQVGTAWGSGANVVVPVDLNGDGAPDILVPNEIRPTIGTLMNDGKGSFNPGADIPVPFLRGVQYLATAVDHDGTRYLAAAGVGGIVLLGQAGDREHFEAQRIRLQSYCQYLVLQDIDGDGWLDLVGALAGGAGAPDVIFGPLWETFSVLAAQQASSKKESRNVR
jgi:hypothetical protein